MTLGQIQVIIFENSSGFTKMKDALVTFTFPVFFTGKGCQLPFFFFFNQREGED